MSDSSIPPRPPTPQVLIHRLPDKIQSDAPAGRPPAKYIVLLMGSTGTAGKVQIAGAVAKALACPHFNGDSLHESSAKAASVRTAGADHAGPNETRYRRMWLSKLTRTGMLFPDESRAATEGFSGFGGSSGGSATTSRRGSASSVASEGSLSVAGGAGGGASLSSSFSSSGFGTGEAHRPFTLHTAGTRPSGFVLNPVFTLPETERKRRENPALMVLTHPMLERWHREAIRAVLGDYEIGVIFVPLNDEVDDDEEEEEEEELPILRPLDPRTMTSFPVSFDALRKKERVVGNLEREMKLRINVDADVEGRTEEIVDGVREIMGIESQSGS